MSPTPKTGTRYKDVLFALDVAGSYDQALGKLQLQKFVYLADTLSPVWEIISVFGYETYFHGPYDPNVQNAVDVLAFRGAVDILSINFEADEKVHVTYKISKSGIQIANELREDLGGQKKYELYKTIGYYVNSRGWHKLKDFVYSEGTYLLEKTDRLGKPLKLDSFLSNQTFKMLLGFNSLTGNPDLKISKENMISIFFRILDQYELLRTDR